MKVRVLTHDNKDRIQMGATLEFKSKWSIGELVVWVAEQYGVQYEKGVQHDNKLYKRIAIVNANNFNVITTIYEQK